MSNVAPGIVYFVGAGPGEAELITLRGATLLSQAQVVLYDYLVNPRLLQHAPHAELVCLGRHGRERIWSQEEIQARIVAEALAGRTVVRLKCGDPTIFAHLAEELAALDAANLRYEIVPGVTAAMASGAYAGFPLTQRDAASAVALVTGQEGNKAAENALDYASLAQFPGTIVFYMGVTTAPHWSRALIEGGKSPDTPVAVIRRVSWPDQSSESTTLAGLPALIEARRIRPPVIIVVGDVAASPSWRQWFTARPLFGRRILVTRPQQSPGDLAQRLTEAGAEVLFQPAIEIRPVDDWSPVDAMLDRLDQFDWIVFSSANGVGLIRRLLDVRHDIRALGPARLAAVGPGTAAELRNFGLRAEVVPETFQAEGLAAALQAQPSGRRALLVRGSRGRETLGEELRAAGWTVEQVAVYQSLDVATADPEIAAELRAGRIDWVTVTSSAIARSLVALFGDDLRRTQLASISPLTSAACSAAGYPPTAEAAVATMPGLTTAILAAEHGQDNATG